MNTERETQDQESRNSLNFHRSPAQVAETMLAVEGARLRRLHTLHEIACGDGALVLPLRQAGFTVRASDVVDRGCPDSFLKDFFAEDRFSYRGVRIGCFTNPPFNRDEEFVMQACERYDYVAMVLRLRFLAAKHLVDEGGTPRRDGEPMWQQTRIPFARLILPKSRWPMMHREGFTGEKTESGMTDCAIFVWEAGHRGPAVIVREPDGRHQPNLLTGDAA